MAPVAIVARLPIKPDKAAAFEAVFVDLAKQVHANEPGCLLYQLAKGKKPGDYVVLEIYESAEAMGAHGKSAHFKEGGKKQKGMFGGKPSIQMMQTVGPSGLKKGDATMAIIAELKIKADGGAGFEKATLPLMEEVQAKEPGNLLYALCKGKDPTKYVFMELYTDKAAIKHHGGTAYFKAGGKRQAPFMGGRPTIDMLQTVGPSGAKL